MEGELAGYSNSYNEDLINTILLPACEICAFDEAFLFVHSMQRNHDLYVALANFAFLTVAIRNALRDENEGFG